MRLAIGSDHAGFDWKEKVKAILEKMGHKVTDYGTGSTDSVDYPDFGLEVAHAVADGNFDYGINICGTGNGMAIASNKVKGIRAGLALNPEMAYMTRLHNNANLLVLSQRFTPENDLEEIIRLFLSTKFEGGRHIPRIEKIMKEEM